MSAERERHVRTDPRVSHEFKEVFYKEDFVQIPAHRCTDYSPFYSMGVTVIGEIARSLEHAIIF